jgi:anti-sigma regulatory factor (Ser/Thr protein kinase)
VADLASVREIVMRAVAAAGLDPRRTHGFLVAVNEIVTNALTHGVPPAIVEVIATPTAIRVRVHDRGSTFAKRDGPVPQAPDQLHGRGLWMASQLTDELRVDSDTDGTTVTVTVHLRTPPRI